jgi:hypothetical protein
MTAPAGASDTCPVIPSLIPAAKSYRRRRNRAAYMRTYRQKRLRTELIDQAVRVQEDSDMATCNLCHEQFETRAAYMKHFGERRFGPGELHQCLTRNEMREQGNLLPDWETGAWKVRR